MATSALRELQFAAVPLAIGTIAAVYSNIIAMKLVGKVRTALEKSYAQAVAVAATQAQG